MDWSASHGAYVLAAYLVALAIVLGCILSTWLGARRK